ncbi:MAG TPA: hypothetical protein VGH16_01045 [Candidatus Binatia bacterium]|jgi:hypothetical protein
MQAGDRKAEVSLPLRLLVFGILFDAAAFAYPPLSLGAADGLRMRLFHLARVAAVALPLLAIFSSDLAARVGGEDGKSDYARRAMLFGAAAMPLVLTAAAFTRIELRMLLPLPALAVVYAALSASLLARRCAPRPELWGWRLVAAGTAAGLVMGLYAFDAPLLGNFAGAYDGVLRATIRAAHEAAIVAGMALISLCQVFGRKGAADEDRPHRHRRRQAADA